MTTVKEFLDSFQPSLNERTLHGEGDPTKGWSADEWFAWPPDVFALTAFFLKQTGAYIFAVLPRAMNGWPEVEDWEETIRTNREDWFRWIQNDGSELPDLLENFKAAEGLFERVSMSDIRSLVRKPFMSDERVKTDGLEDAWAVSVVMLELHALSDATCAGFGMPADRYHRSDPTHKAIQFIANILLAHTGSLSRLPTHYIRVLPKVRTPNVGLTLRSLSHYLTMHQSEVSVNWRTIPWVNSDENTVNIMVVPWPYEIQASSFQPSAFVTNRKSLERTRYFDYRGGQLDFPVDDLLAMIDDAQRHVHRVHFVVFPELALTSKELDSILDSLANHMGNGRRHQIPMVLAGVWYDDSIDGKEGNGKPSTEEDNASGQKGIESADENISRPNGINKVVLSTFFAGKWYLLEQHKHHRWKLNEYQIEQYALGGVLAGSRNWWEAIEIKKRHLSILAPNEWLMFCPLICEDLARQEPIAEVIRGVGPTLVTAILLDGPQIMARWPGRYASILADDPGSSVLTVTSLGMTKRSRPTNPQRAPSRSIALWKDDVGGAEAIEIDDEYQGVVLTAAAHWKEEFTADGRTNHRTSASFVLHGVHRVTAGGSKPEGGAESKDSKPFEYERSDVNDFLEITLFSYFIDAVLECETIEDVEALKGWIPSTIDLPEPSQESHRFHNIRPYASLSRVIREETNRLIETSSREPLLPFVEWACDLVCAIIEDNPSLPSANGHNGASRLESHSRDIDPRYDTRVSYFEVVLKWVEFILRVVSNASETEKEGSLFAEEDSNPFDDPLYEYEVPYPISPEEAQPRRVRVCIYTCLSLLWAMHKRLSDYRRSGQLEPRGARILVTVETLLKNDYDRVWYAAIAANKR